MKSNRGAFLVNLDNHNEETDKYTENMNREQIQEDIKTLLRGFPSTMETTQTHKNKNLSTTKGIKMQKGKLC